YAEERFISAEAAQISQIARILARPRRMPGSPGQTYSYAVPLPKPSARRYVSQGAEEVHVSQLRSSSHQSRDPRNARQTQWRAYAHASQMVLSQTQLASEKPTKGEQKASSE